MIRRFSSRRKKLDRSFLNERLSDALAYDRIAGYFSSSLLEVAGEALESVSGPIRIVCNSTLDPGDVQTARAAQMAVVRSWCAFQPELLLEGQGEVKVRERFKRLFELLCSGKLKVRVLPENAFGLIHGKAGVITLANGSKTSFLGSANESKAAWQMNYELIWEDSSPEAVNWVQEEFNALWGSPNAVPLADFVIEDLARLSERKIVYDIEKWAKDRSEAAAPEAAPALIETPVYRKEVGLWEHQKYFVNLVFNTLHSPVGKSRFVLADQVGLGKTLQLAMSALLIALTSENPILIICPKPLVWQWQGEMRDLLDMPSAVWTGKHWVDENDIEHPAGGPEYISRCPRRMGIVSSGLITRRSEAAEHLLKLKYDCVILDEAHRARRKNLGENRDNESPDPNNLLSFMYRISAKTRSLLLATATPVQLRPIEAWDLLDILSRGEESVLGNIHSPWRKATEALNLIMGHSETPVDDTIIWEWIRNPMPPKAEHIDFEVLRRQLNVQDEEAVVPGDAVTRLSAPSRTRIIRLFPRFIQEHNPFIRRIIRRARQQLETQIDPETNEPLLDPIGVELHGESLQDAILLPPYLREAYDLSEQFCRILGKRLRGAGFLKTLLLRRIGSSIYSGLRTAQRMLETWESVEAEIEDEEEPFGDEEVTSTVQQIVSKTLTDQERSLLERVVAALEANQELDPKYRVVRRCLLELRWLDMGCIIFSQYRDSILWLAEQITSDLPNEPIAVYSGAATSGIMREGRWFQESRERLKQMVMGGQLRLMLVSIGCNP